MTNAKNVYMTQTKKPNENYYARQLLWDVKDKIDEGFECLNIAGFKETCSDKELLELTEWNHTTFGEELCDLVDEAIDLALKNEETVIENVNSISIHEYYNNYSKRRGIYALLELDDPDHKLKKQIYEMLQRLSYYR